MHNNIIYLAAVKSCDDDGGSDLWEPNDRMIRGWKGVTTAAVSLSARARAFNPFRS